MLSELIGAERAIRRLINIDSLIDLFIETGELMNNWPETYEPTEYDCDRYIAVGSDISGHTYTLNAFLA